GALTRAWSTAFTSIFMPAEGGGGGSEVLGPAAVSATGNGCSTHRSAGTQSCRVLAILSLSHRGVEAATGREVPQLGHLYRLNGHTGRARSVSNVGDQNYAWTARHAKLFPDFPDANPYAVLNIRGHDGHRARTFVADAAANTISVISRTGRSRVISYIPNETSGAMRDATPTCIAQGPDGALYVGALDLASNFGAGSGQSNVWRVNPNSTNWRHNATLWATGYTTINGCTFDRHGNFWASELFYPNAAGPPGDLAMAPFRHPSGITHLGGGALPLPGGIAQGPDGAMYVSTGSADTNPHSGAVVRVAAH
ncbi:MAG: ScyD/ScyE family protein, partial [Actinomycetota bacterium]|nr:ScyD/ScyE family protein [Actinomycetota bacterium]